MSSDRALAEFIERAEEWAQDLAAALGGLGAQPDRADLVDTVFRRTHNYKNSGDLGFACLAGLAHRMEDALTPLRSGAIAVTPAILDSLSAGADVMADMVAAIGRGEGDGTIEAAGVMEELARWVPSSAVTPTEPAAEPAREAAPDPRLLAAFLEDAEDRSQKLSSLVAVLEPGAVNTEAIHETFRAAHDLKSASATAGFHRMARLAHRMEDVLHRVRDGVLPITEPVRDALIEGADRIAEMVAVIGRGDPESSVDVAAAVAALSAFAPPPAEGPGGQEPGRRHRGGTRAGRADRAGASAPSSAHRYAKRATGASPCSASPATWIPPSRCGLPGHTCSTRVSRTR